MRADEFLRTQEILEWGEKPSYWAQVQDKAYELSTDGCSGPTIQVYVYACWEHDIHYRTHLDLEGRPISQEMADYIFRERHKQWSPLDGYSPMAHWRWAMLRLFGKRAWEGSESGSPIRTEARNGREES